MSEPAYYTGEYHQPGLISEVGLFAAAVMLVLLLFIAVIVGARYLLLTSRRLSPRKRRLLRLLGGLATPASERASRRRRREARRRTEVPHYVLEAAGTTAAATLAGDPAGTAERPLGRRRLPRNLVATADEAWPFYDEDEVAAVTEVLRSGKVNQWTGTQVFEFERVYGEMLGGSRAIALANGSLALELALRAFRIGPGDEVIVAPRSFVASAFCVRLVGATPVFVDIDPDSGAITAEAAAAAITPRTRAIIPVHLGGWPADMPAIAELARARGILVIEDCAQAHGAELNGAPVGSFGDAAAFSFCQDKIISTAGEGGLVAFKDDRAYERAWSFKDHGKNRSRALEKPAQPGFRWLHDEVGTNWRLTEIAATVGLIQLDKLPEWHRRRTANAQIWANALRDVGGLRVPEPARGVRPAYYKFYFHLDVDPARDEALRNRILKEAGEAGLRVFSGSCSEIYREAAFADMRVDPLPVAKRLGETSLMVEVHPTLDPRRLRDRAEALAALVDDVLRSA